MRVDQDIRNYPTFGEWHVRAVEDDSYDAFLTVPRSKLVPNLWYAQIPGPRLHEFVSLRCRGYENHVNYPFLAVSDPYRTFPTSMLGCNAELVHLF
ncbi:hypothetical protein ES703_109288 [subsurface metagenome]